MKRCVVVYVKFPKTGEVKTRLGNDLGMEQACELYRDVAERLITEVYPIGDAYQLVIFCDPSHAIEDYQNWLGHPFTFHHQVGDHLGLRLQNTVKQMIEDGFDKIIIVGSDCLGFDEETLSTWFSHLDQRDLLLGPTADGGYYLIGMSRNHPGVFHNIPWSTDGVMTATLNRIEDLGLSYWMLEERFDLDTLEDLTAFRESLPENHYLAHKIDRLVLERLAALKGNDDLE
ncbi:MAG: TIGR04282 family arsenosugar biosynthesis glycosyltransferase [Acidobacteria bacterium]|nr:TIGR04282 family arsenosugar biosynthesis glycosyltransferase [Acidobacteriota bacterium]